MPATIMLDGCSSLDQMIAMNRKVRVLCDRCKAVNDIDLSELRDRVGGEYSLINRQCKCRMTPGCEGWNRFYVKQGVFRPLWDGRWV